MESSGTNEQHINQNKNEDESRENALPKGQKDNLALLAKKFINALLSLKSFVGKAFSKVFIFLYPICYLLGSFSILFYKRAIKAIIKSVLNPIYRVARFAYSKSVGRAVGAVKMEAVRFGGGFSIASRKMREAKQTGTKSVVIAALSLPFLAIRRHFGVVAGLGKIALSGVAVFLLVSTIQFWTGDNMFALAVEYEGETLGYVIDESVFDLGADLATAKVINADNSFKVERVPNLTLTIVNHTQVVDETEICERILKNSSAEIAELSGVYIDGEFAGTVYSRKALDILIEARLSEFSSEGDDETVSFIEKIEIVDGIFPLSSLKTISAETNTNDSVTAFMFSSEITAVDDTMNNVIKNKTSVQVVKKISYTEEIKYENKTESSDTLYVGETKAKSSGSNGEKLFTAELTFVNGEQIEKVITSEEITKEVVHNITLKGSKKPASALPSSNGDGVYTGSFVWTVPSCRTVWSGFGWRGGSAHKGIDISGSDILNKPIIAADGGKVVQVVSSGWGGGYGLFVIIDHGNGVKTRYAHMNSIDVSVGQKVTRGQMIGRVGNTGRSSGPHLHFEVLINGTAVDPMQYY